MNDENMACAMLNSAAQGHYGESLLTPPAASVPGVVRKFVLKYIGILSDSRYARNVTHNGSLVGTIERATRFATRDEATDAIVHLSAECPGTMRTWQPRIREIEITPGGRREVSASQQYVIKRFGTLAGTPVYVREGSYGCDTTIRDSASVYTRGEAEHAIARWSVANPDIVRHPKFNIAIVPIVDRVETVREIGA